MYLSMLRSEIKKLYEYLSKLYTKLPPKAHRFDGNVRYTDNTCEVNNMSIVSVSAQTPV